MPERNLKVSQVSKIIGISTQDVRGHCIAGHFKGATRYYGPRSNGDRPTWLIPESAVDQFMEDLRREHDRRLRAAA